MGDGSHTGYSAKSVFPVEARSVPFPWAEHPEAIENVSDSAKPSETEPSPTENPKPVSVWRIVARRICSKCSKAAHLASVAANAVRNCDFYRVLDLLEEIRTMCGSTATGLSPSQAIISGVVDSRPVSLERLRKRLLELRAEILSEGDVAIEPARTDPVAGSGEEEEQALTEMNQVIASKRNRERTTALARVQAALRRLEQAPEDFGLCVECGDPIGKRLEVMPYDAT